jgi:pimeloyl-ACP methyl ester carboxylesterase
MASAFVARAIKAGVGLGSRALPSVFGTLAYRLFTTPLRFARLSPSEKRLELRASVRLNGATPHRIRHAGGEVQAYQFVTTQPTSLGSVVLVHGWMSGARFMLAFVDVLNDIGFDVVCFDLPAHGKSSGRRTDFIECANALVTVVEHFAPVRAVIAHSFGGAVTGAAIGRLVGVQAPLSVEKIVLLASPNELSNVARNFGAAIGIGPAAQAYYEKRLEADGGRPLGQLTGAALYGPAAVPMLALHSDDDAEVPVAQGIKYGALPHCTFEQLSGFGHRRILYAALVVQRVAAFLQPRT